MVNPDQLLYETSGVVHSNIQVRQRGDVRYLRFGSSGGWQGAVRCGGGFQRPVFAYQRAFASLAESLPAPEAFLSLGVGTGTAMHTVGQLHPACRLDGVDIDQAVIELALHYFGAPEPGQARYYVHDAVVFCDHCDRVYDLVFVDVYQARAVDERVLAPSFADRLHQILRPGGVAVCNIIGRLPVSHALRAFARAAASRFPAVWVLPVGSAPAFVEQNMLWVLCDGDDSVARWRTAMRTSLWLSPWERALWPMRLRRMSADSARDADADPSR
ncbi:spermidine synthase [Alicyclobacillus macrosporangiidus]|uniref:spermidine synthase n=1 Tax=Alicyclobacillus macrosporangiidus TaxID=392015 RepID=UPI0006896967|nr:methyltransferase domain-containing protein [Alicyclobacillus macrosporangiidus]